MFNSILFINREQEKKQDKKQENKRKDKRKYCKLKLQAATAATLTKYK